MKYKLNEINIAFRFKQRRISIVLYDTYINLSDREKEEYILMTEKLIQLRVEDNVKDKCDELFAANGLTTQSAIKMMLTQVAHSGETPFDNLFAPHN